MNQLKQTTKPRFYRAFGAVARSEFDLPELEEVGQEAVANYANAPIDVIAGAVPDALRSEKVRVAWIRISDCAALYEISSGTRIYVPDANTIVLQTDGQCAPEKLSAYIISCALPTIAYLRNMVPVHASMVSTPRGITMFAGNSGAGKSTAATAYSREPGHFLLCDDIAIFEKVAGEFHTIHFHNKHIKLWYDAVKHIGVENDILTRDSFRENKFHLQYGFTGTKSFLDLKRVVFLDWGEAILIKPMRPSSLFSAIMNTIYAPVLAGPFGKLHLCRQLTSQLSSIAQGISVIRNRNINDIGNVLSEIKKAL